MTQATEAPASGRQHTYLSGEERRELDRLRSEHGASASYVLRMGLRALAGLPVPLAVAPLEILLRVDRDKVVRYERGSDG